MKIFDISMPVENGMPVYPGDPKVKIVKIKTFQKNGVIVSKITMGLHAGTHIDAPRHYLPDGKTIDQIPLECLTGKAVVCDLSSVEDCIKAKDLRKFAIDEGDIIFLKTKNSQTRENAPKNQICLNEDGADYLIEKEIKAVGIDCLSIERFDSSDARIHKKLLGREIPIIEGLVLGNVDGGRYLTHCAPLKIIDAEASPARCVLVRTDG
jgi:arylformamidase